MTYRDDLEAAGERARALERDLQRAEEENERLRQELERAKNPPPPEPPPEPGAAPDGASGNGPAGDGRSLSDAVARGRAIREAAEDREQRVAREVQARRMRDRQNAFPRSLTGWGYYARLGFLIGFPLIVWAFMGFILLLSQGRQPPLAAFLLPPILAAIMFLIGRWRAARAAERERRWLATLPFQVVGYEFCFTGAGRNLETLVYFKDKRPDQAMLGDALLALDPGATVQPIYSGGVPQGDLELRLPIRHYKGVEHTINRMGHRRFHELVEFLLKVHADYPIDRVQPEID